MTVRIPTVRTFFTTRRYKTHQAHGEFTALQRVIVYRPLGLLLRAISRITSHGFGLVPD